MGLTKRQISWLVTSGQWHRPVRGVYLVAGAPATWQQALVTACLAGPAGTVASRRSAAALFGFCAPPDRPEIMVPPAASARQVLATVHRSHLGPADRCTIGGIPSVTPARAVIDSASVMSPADLCDLVDTAFYRRNGLARQVQVAIERLGSQGRHGVRSLREAMSPWTSGVRPGSPAEARCIRAFDRWGLPTPERQHEIQGEDGAVIGRADFAWPAFLVLFEYDGEEYHGPSRWLADAEREAGIVRLGWAVERGDKEDFRPSATDLRDRLRKLLGLAEAV